MTEYLRRYDALYREMQSLALPWRKNVVLKAIGRGKRVLDLGCLGGQFSRQIQERNNDVFGVELNHRAAEQARARGIPVQEFDLNDGIPFEECFFDVVHAAEVLEQIYDTKFLFEEVHRVLRPEGVFVFTVPNLNSIRNRIRVLQGNFLENYGSFPEDHDGENIRVFNLRKVRELCSFTGFEILKVSGVASTLEVSTRHLLKTGISKALPQLSEMLVVRARRID